MEAPEPRPVREVKRWWAMFSYGRAAVWIVMIPVAVLLEWVKSIMFIAACSLYANAAGDLSAARSDTDAQLDRIEDKLDWLIERERGRHPW